MTGILTAFLGAVIPSLVVGIILYRINRKSDERYEEEKEKANERAEAAQLQMDMILACAALSYAVAKALQRGTTNGEVEEGIELYENAKRRYYTHINSEYYKARESAR